jgi:hydroxyquinol 1,2-dioxygenase
VQTPEERSGRTPSGANLTDWDLSEEKLTQAVRDSFRTAETERLRTILDALVRHLHEFVRETGLTEREWFAGIDFLTRTGHITDENRQEFILLSDVLGVSMLIIRMNNRKPEGATQATVLGPFFVPGSPRYENGDDLANGAPGSRCLVRGRIVATSGGAVAGARVDVWQADEEGLYDVQYPDLPEGRGRGHMFSESDGRFWFWTVRPTAYPIPTDGPVGDLLRVAGRQAMRPAHIHFRIEADGYETLTTHVFADDDPYLHTDAVFGVNSSLIAPFLVHDGDEAAYHTLDYEFVLVPDA